MVAISKTLESGLEGERLYKEYLETGETELLETFKQYCKNDVRMTALVFLYLMHYKKVFIEGEEITFDLEDIVNKSNREIKDIS
ncbi:MAG: ribonuclease H-like domain-containing protein [bacterium]